MWRLVLALVVVIALLAVYAAFKLAIIGLGVALLLTVAIWLGQYIYRK